MHLNTSFEQPFLQIRPMRFPESINIWNLSARTRKLSAVKMIHLAVGRVGRVPESNPRDMKQIKKALWISYSDLFHFSSMSFTCSLFSNCSCNCFALNMFTYVHWLVFTMPRTWWNLRWLARLCHGVYRSIWIFGDHPSVDRSWGYGGGQLTGWSGCYILVEIPPKGRPYVSYKRSIFRPQLLRSAVPGKVRWHRSRVRKLKKSML